MGPGGSGAERKPGKVGPVERQMGKVTSCWEVADYEEGSGSLTFSCAMSPSDCPTPAPLSPPSGDATPQPPALYISPRPASLTSSSPPTPVLQRFSAASLPLPQHIPFHPSPTSPPPAELPMRPSPSPRAGSPPPSPSLPRPLPHSPSPAESRDDLSSSSSSSSSYLSTGATTSSTSSAQDLASSPTKPDSLSSHDPALPSPRSVSPHPTLTLSSRLQSSDLTTAMFRFMSAPHNNHHSLPDPALTDSSFPPPPDPPVILPPDPPDDSAHPASSLPSRAPYVPFLSSAPPPPGCSVHVETTHSEYRLNVRLPGFSREGITLATKRRRILHVVANSWENGGGHFERRISFGYDADLVQVRAEFDGVMLRIFVPRRVSPVNWYSARPGPIGRA